MSLTKVSYSMINGAPVNVLDYGAVGDGSTDDTAAIQAALNYATPIKLAVYFPSGTYLISSALTFSGNDVTLFGDSDCASWIYTTSNITMIEIDNTNDMYNGVIRDLGFKAEIAGTRTSNIGIRVKSNTDAWFAFWKFENLRFLGVNTCWSGDAKPPISSPPFNVTTYAYCLFTNWQTEANSLGHYSDYGIRYLGGPGAHSTYSLLHISANTYGIAMGDGTSGIGDTIITACTFSFCDYGIYMLGPTNSSEYRDQISITSCQFDGASTGACHLIHMRNFRLIGNNYGGLDILGNRMVNNLENCSDYQTDDADVFQSLYGVYKENLGVGATVDLFSVQRSVSYPAALDTFSSMVIDVTLTGVCAGQGPAYAIYKYAVEYTTGVPVVTLIDSKVKTGGGIITMSYSIASNIVTFKATVNGTDVAVPSNLAASTAITGRYYKLNRL